MMKSWGQKWSAIFLNIFWRIFTILLLIIENFCTSPHDTCTITPGVVCFKNRLGHVLLLNPGCKRTGCWDLGNLCPNLMKLSRVSNPPKTGFKNRRLISWNIEYNFKWNQPYLSRGLNLSRSSNSLNSAYDQADYISLVLNLSPLSIRRDYQVQTRTNLISDNYFHENQTIKHSQRYPSFVSYSLI